MNKLTLKTICFGEVLWDVFPSYKKIGGAPLNVCIRLESLGANASIISSVGNDNTGDELLKRVKQTYPNISTQYIQLNKKYPTSEAIVKLDANGVAKYDIKNDVAWDNIIHESNLVEAVKNTDVFLYGSLVSRNITSRETLLKLLALAKFKVFDVNLRPPYYSIQLLMDFMKHANFIKFNDEEIHEVTNALGLKNNLLEEQIRYISKNTNTQIICVTRGANGAVLFFEDNFYYNKGYSVKVLDTVGSGDSFLASIVYKIGVSNPPQKALDFACAVGALVASNEGANPKITLQEIDALIMQ